MSDANGDTNETNGVAEIRAAAPTAIVTGAGGWFGQNLVRTLVRQPGRERVRCLVATSDEVPRLEVLDAGVEVVQGDVRDPAVIDRLFDGVGRISVFHTAGVIHPTRGTRELFDVNVGGTQLVIDRARRVGANRFVHVSSNSVYGANASASEVFDEGSPFHPYMSYGASKREAEQIVERAFERGDLATVVLWPPWFYGPFQPDRQTRFFASIRRGTFPLVAPGTQRRSMVYTGNLVQGALRAEVSERAPGHGYWIGDAEPYELQAIIGTVRDALEAEGLAVTRRRPIRVPRAAAQLAERIDGALQAAGRYSQAIHVLGELKDTIACDISRARKELGYEPTIELFEGMRASVRYCLERGLPL